MRVLAAILTITWPGLATASPIANIASCAFTLGPAKCLSALTSWRAEKALTHPEVTTKLSEDFEFPWTKYSNRSDEELHSQLCDETERLLRRKPLSLVVPGYRFEVLSRDNGTLHVDLYRESGDDPGSSRNLKKAKKKLMNILPLILVPGLIMSAILPFVLPALKMMTMGAVMLNNMAFTGALFTLLRNNAFNDKYDHKVIYTNEGYDNEKHYHYNQNEHEQFDGSNAEYVVDDRGAPMDNLVQSQWMQQFQEPDTHLQIANGEFVQFSGDQYKRKSSRIKTNEEN